APLLRVGLIKLAHTPAALRGHPRRGTYTSQEGNEPEHILMVDMHHIISDGVTMEIFINEFLALNRGETLPQLRLQYKDFSNWWNRHHQSGVLRKQGEFWLKRFQGKLPELKMPLDFPRPRNRGSEGDTRGIRMEEDLQARVKKHMRRSGTTIYQFLLAVYNVLLYKYTGQTDIIVGSPVSGRRHADLQGIVGVFVNMVAIRNYPGPGKTFAEFLEEVKTNALDAHENQDYPFDQLVNQLRLQGKPGRNPVFDVGFLYNALEIRKIQDPHLKITPYEVRHRVSRFDMLMGVWEDSGGIEIRLEYSTQLFKSTGIDGFLKHYMDILRQVTENLQIKMEDIEIETGLKTITSKKPEIQFGF
ncbi:MAG: non-ribosomal peptide synthetase, partial [Candidatus Aminicenantes bacterium]